MLSVARNGTALKDRHASGKMPSEMEDRGGFARNGVKKEEVDDADTDDASFGTPNIDHKLPLRTPKSFDRSNSHSPVKQELQSRTQTPQSEMEETVGGDVTLKLEPGKAPKLARSASHKVKTRPPPLFSDEEDKTKEACSTFTVIKDCEYQNKWLGQTDEDLDLEEIECECEQSWDPTTESNSACGEDSDCINRATKIECIGDCRCGPLCQNRRFQLKQYANTAVFKTEKKGYGLRAESDLRPNDFIFEYIGEVISEGPFERRRGQYDKEKIKHFYFMSLSKGEYIDATKKGNIGRFCNHSCNPNCYVDKWMVNDKLRMGIFASRLIKTGEELTFDYNVDRYGADPQPCYCGEPNCTGYLGGKTQTDRGTRLAHDVVEALGIEDGDDWDMAMPKKTKRKKTGEVDEEYVNKVQPKVLEEDVVSKVMSQLMQKKEKWIVVKLLQRIQTAVSETVFARVVKMHGYRILKSVLSSFMADSNVCLQILDILFKLPRITRNKIHDSKIEEVVQKVATEQEDEKVKEQAANILEVWSKLEMGYRIPRIQRDAADSAKGTPPARIDFDDRRNRQKRERSESRSPSPRRLAAPSGPRSNIPQRQAPSFRPNFPPRPRSTLPDGWKEYFDVNGKAYYHSTDGQTSWTRPTQPASAVPPPPPKTIKENERLDAIIADCLKDKESPVNGTGIGTPQTAGESLDASDKSDGWGSWPVEKQKKHYKGVIAPMAARIAGKHKDVIPKDRLKEYIKEITNLITDRHFAKGVARNVQELPRDLRKKTEAQVKEFLDKARKKYQRHADAKKSNYAGSKPGPAPGSPDTPADGQVDRTSPMSKSPTAMNTEQSPIPPPPPPQESSKPSSDEVASTAAHNDGPQLRENAAAADAMDVDGRHNAHS